MNPLRLSSTAPVLLALLFGSQVAAAASPQASAGQGSAGQVSAAPAPPAEPAAAPVASPEILRAVAKLAGGDVKPEDVRTTQVPGIYEIHRGADIVYMSRDGQYLFTGDLYQVAGQNNLTEAHRRELRRQLIDAIPESDMLVFSPAQPKYTVTVFTDVDCSYCRALHSQIAEYNRLGVKVRYVFFPRTGPNTESWHKAEQVWCSADRKAALTQAKLGQPLAAKPCANTPVAKEYQLAKAIGLDGTPGIVATNGTLVGGYLPPDALLAQLQELEP